MKKLILFFLILTACENDQIESIQPNHVGYFRVTKDVRVPKAGMWHGVITYEIPGIVFHTINCNREIRYLSDSVIDLRWWSSPDTSVQVLINDTIRYTMTADYRSISCGNQRTIFDFTSTGYVENDTLKETGIVRYRFYYNDSLRIESVGWFKSWSEWERIIHY